MDKVNLESNYNSLIGRIEDACRKHHRDSSGVKLVAVSKTKPIEDIAHLYSLGVRDFGENYLQEAVEKINSRKLSNINWHYIGGIQSNKCKQIAKNFHVVHSVDRLNILDLLNKEAEKNSNKILNIFIQVQVEKTENRSGCSFNECIDLINRANQLKHIKIQGLMCLPDSIETAKDTFFKVADFQKYLNEKSFYAEKLNCLSMGMTNDFELAIEAGSTHIRVGSAIFGPRL